MDGFGGVIVMVVTMIGLDVVGGSNTTTTTKLIMVLVVVMVRGCGGGGEGSSVDVRRRRGMRMIMNGSSLFRDSVVFGAG